MCKIHPTSTKQPKRGIIKLLLFFCILPLNGCIPTTLLIEIDRIVQFEISENESDYIEISGLIGESSYNYKNIDVIVENQDMRILLYGELAVLNENGSGSFNITIPIDKNINRIFFGNNKSLIWERKSLGFLKIMAKIKV